MTGVLMSVALACFAIGGVFDLVVGTARARLRWWPYALCTIGSVALVVDGVRAVVSPVVSLHISRVLAAGPSALRLDALAGLFLTLLFSLATAISLSFITWIRGDRSVHRRGLAASYSLLLFSIALVVCAADAFLFLFAWELLAVSFYVATSVSRAARRRPEAAWSTLGMSKVSGAALLFAFMLLGARAHSLVLANWHHVGSGATLDVAWTLLVVGFAAKLGLVPFQVWIPVGYPAAPGPMRAAMAGVGANVAVYGLWRFLGILGPPPTWLVISVLIIGGVSALLGITFAAVQSSLTRVVSYSSIENAGLITTAFGIAMAGAILRLPELEAVGLLAATLQTVAHAVAKSALFVSLANLEALEGTDDLDHLRGIGRRARWSGTTFGVGALTLAGLPPTIGFVSEWFILEALMQQFRVPGLALRLGLAFSAALVALTTGLAALVFLRVVALSILGRPHQETVRHREAGIANKVGLSLLGASCLVLAAVSPLEIRFLADGLAPVVPRSLTLRALKSPWILQPVFKGFSILSPSWLWIALPTALALTALITVILSRGGLRVRRVPAWHSATSGTRGPTSYSAFAFANPLRHVLRNILGTRRTTEVADPGLASDEELVGPHLETHTVVIEPLETYVYRPLRVAAVRVARLTKRLQSGRLGAYAAYMLVALLASLAIVSALH